MIRSGLTVSTIAARNVQSVTCVVPRRGKKKKLDLIPLEGEDAKYFNPTLLSGINEPEYIDLLKPPTPFHQLINIKLMCPDFVYLERFTKFLQKRLPQIGLNVNKYWPLQHLEYKYDLLKHEESIVENSMVLKFYRRVLQLKDTEAYKLPMIIQIIDASKPSGLTYAIAEHSEADEIARYVEDTNLKAMKTELAEAIRDLDFSK
ncbi:mitochondrial ribosomal protein L48 [Brevipalpus obovatus]|uniref:mitochondrial ribosomal protein L48 n=1 Tax=Brevipalpus obovatus TaxID=246614 RepID=UPI003D9F25E8